MKNKKNLIFGIIAAIAFIVGLVLMAGPKKNEAGNTPAATASVFSAAEAFFDFGEIKMSGGIVQHNFAVKNTQSEPIKITSIYTSCMCTTASLLLDGEKTGPFGMPGHGFGPSINKIVEPGKDFTVEAVFDPNAHGPAGVGRNDRTVYVKTDSGSTLELSFTALVTP